MDRAFVVRVMAGHVPTKDQLETAKRRGLSGLVAQIAPRVDGFGLDDAEITKLLTVAKAAKVSVAVSLEHPSFGEQVPQKTPRIFKAARADLFGRQSVEGEQVAAERACAIAKVAGAKVTILGVTTAETLRVVQAAKSGARGASDGVCAFAVLVAEGVQQAPRSLVSAVAAAAIGAERLRLRRAFAESTALLAIGAGAQPSPAIPAWTLEKQPRPQALASLPWATRVLVAAAATGPLRQRRLVRALSGDTAAFFGLAGERGIIAIGAVADLAGAGFSAAKKLGPKNPKTSDEFNPFVGTLGTEPPSLVFNRGRLVAQNGQRAGTRPEGVPAVRMT